MGLQPPGERTAWASKPSHPASFGDRDVAGAGGAPETTGHAAQVKLGRVAALAPAPDIPSHSLTCSPKRVAVFL